MSSEANHIKRLLSHGVVELRCFDKRSPEAIKKGRPVIWSGWYDDYNALVAAAKSGARRGMDIYSTINPIRIPAKNTDLRAYSRTAKDVDVTNLRTIFFDFDAVREKGTQSTEHQISLCRDQAMQIADFLEEEGWSAPTFGMSGNGVHLLYYTDGIDKDAKPEIRALYAGLAKRFSTDEVGFDVSVKNPARIARLLGTINYKGGRRSYAAYSNQETPGGVILSTAHKLTPPKTQRNWCKPVQTNTPSGEHLSGTGLFSRMQGRILQEISSGKWWVTCPNEHQHGQTSKTDSVLWFDGKYITYHCSHAHCSHIDAQELNKLV